MSPVLSVVDTERASRLMSEREKHTIDEVVEEVQARLVAALARLILRYVYRAIGAALMLAASGGVWVAHIDAGLQDERKKSEVFQAHIDRALQERNDLSATIADLNAEVRNLRMALSQMREELAR